MNRPPYLTALLLLLGLPLGSSARAEDAPTYEQDIKPVLNKRCTVCHNAKKVGDEDLSGGLALDTYEAIRKGTADHTIVTPGKGDESELYRRLVETDEFLRMPLMEPPLPEDQRTLIQRWIDAGMPRGEASVPAGNNIKAEASAPPSRRLVRTLDVVLPSEVKVPKGVEGMGEGGPLEVALKIGPLPPVSAVVFRPDGGQLAVGTAGQVVIWDMENHKPAATLTGIPGLVHALAYSPDGKQLAVGAGLPARSGSVRVYHVPDGSLQYDLTGHEDVVYGLAFRPDGAQLASAGFDNTVRFWNLASGQPEGVFEGHSDFVNEIAYTPDGQKLLSASKDRSIKESDPKTAEGIRTFSEHNENVLALAIRPDGKGFVTAGDEPQLRWWEFDQPTKSMKRVGGHGGPVHELAFSDNGKRLISAGGDNSVRLWDGQSGASQRSLPGPNEWQYAVALSPDGHLAAAGGWDGIARVWDADNGTLLLTLLQPPGPQADQPDWLALTPQGDWTASDGLNALARWRVGGREVATDAVATAIQKTRDGK